MGTECERTYRSSDGLELSYREFGGPSAGLTVLCLPGLTRNSRDFAPLAHRLAGRYHVLTPDFRGRGRSAWDPQHLNYHPRTYAEDVQRLVSLAASSRLVLVGTSLGGLVSSLLALGGVPGLKGVVLNDIGPELDPTGIARIAGYVGLAGPMRNWDEAVAAVRATNEFALPDLDDRAWLAFARALCRETAEGSVVFDYDPAIGLAFKEGAGGAIDLWESFRALRGTDTLLLRGAHSDILSRDTAQRMQRELPRLRLVEIPRRGHAPLLDEPDSVMAIESFLHSLSDG